MHIYWFGLSAFKIISKDVTIFTDPFSKLSGLTPPRGAGQIVISSSPDNELYNNFSAISGDPFIIDSPGEYDVKGVFVRGIPLEKKKNNNDSSPKLNREAIYTLNLENINVGFLGCFPQQNLTENQIAELNNIDVLMVPVGGKPTCDAEAAVEIINKLEPYVVIPMHYKIPGLSLKLDPLNLFLKELGEEHEEMEKLLIKKNDFQEEKTRIVVLKPQRS